MWLHSIYLAVNVPSGLAKQHSERLENERKGVIKASSSCDGGGIVRDSMVEIVVSLCDKLALIEEECDVLVSSEGKHGVFGRTGFSPREEEKTRRKTPLWKSRFQVVRRMLPSAKITLRRRKQKLQP